MQGYYLIHPMGWDAFGLPAENYAIKNGVHPAISTAENVANIKRQIKEIAAIYDWDREVNTTDPEFYKWTQWIFVQMFKKGLAYEKQMPINWCPSCKTGLANEEVVDGKCERCHSEVTKKNLRQWMLKITAYADRLLADLDKLDWPEKVKKMQTDWIGKSYGAEVNFKVDGMDEAITVYTTRPDTLWGATFMVLAPEHELAAKLATDETREAVDKYIYDASMKSNVDRMQDKEKTGVFTGSYAINPLNGKKTPIWLSDYVLADYGTGAIMCVPAHDDRDFAFAKKFDLPIIQVIAKDGKEIENMTEAYTEASGTMINSGDWNGMESSVLKKEAPEMIEKMGYGKKTVNYNLRDWVFSRQRYWGEPIPMVYCEKCGYHRQEPEVALTKVIEWKDASSVIAMDVFGEKVEAEVMLPGGYNLYNALAATEVAHLLGLPNEQIVKVLGGLTTHFGRMEQVMLNNAPLHLVLVKNPAGFNEVLQFLIQQRPTGNIVFGLNDNYADGKDISWIYDVEFERLTQAASGAKHFYFTGKRAYDMQLRLKYADFDTTKFSVEKDYKTLITQLQQSGQETFLVLSYTCMLEFRDKLAEFVPLKKYDAS